MSLTQLTMWLQHALRRIHGSLSRERRLAGVTCLLVAVFICCYLPFWTVYMCLVRREGGFDKSFPIFTSMSELKNSQGVAKRLLNFVSFSVTHF